jgi:hypothetical protein
MIKSRRFGNGNYVNLVDDMTLAANEIRYPSKLVSMTITNSSHPSYFIGAIFYSVPDEPKEPAVEVKIKVRPINTPGGCVSVSDKQSLSEMMEELLEPRPWDHAPIAVNAHGRD